jgi:hypothetical protein
MTQPTFAQLRNLSTNAVSVVPESRRERILTCFAILCSGQNPDGTPNTP